MVVEFFEEAYVEWGVIVFVVVDFDFGFSGPDIVSIHVEVESGDVGESDFAVEGAESGPDFVVVDAVSAECGVAENPEDYPEEKRNHDPPVHDVVDTLGGVGVEGH